MKLKYAIIGLCLTSCSQADKSVDIEEFVDLMDRSFATSQDNLDTKIQDRRARIKSQNLDGVWFYSQLNTGDEYKLYRQRISHIRVSDDGAEIIQTTYGLKTPERYVDVWKAPDLLENMTPDDFEPYFSEGCEQVWHPDEKDGWVGYVDPKTCIITSSRRNKDIRIESESYLSVNVHRTTERGYDMDMTFLWGSKPGEFIDLYPVP